MRKADSNRLSIALLLSLGIHLIIVAGLNIFNWFPESVIQNSYTPLTVKIETRYVETTASTPIPSPLEGPDKTPN